MPYVYETSNLLTNKKYIGYCSKTPETSKALLGKRITQEHKDNISKAQKGREYQISTCPHCDKSGGVNVMQRCHFKNCKIQHT